MCLYRVSVSAVNGKMKCFFYVVHPKDPLAGSIAKATSYNYYKNYYIVK